MVHLFTPAHVATGSGQEVPRPATEEGANRTPQSWEGLWEEAAGPLQPWELDHTPGFQQVEGGLGAAGPARRLHRGPQFEQRAGTLSTVCSCRTRTGIPQGLWEGLPESRGAPGDTPMGERDLCPASQLSRRTSPVAGPLPCLSLEVWWPTCPSTGTSVCTWTRGPVHVPGTGPQLGRLGKERPPLGGPGPCLSPRGVWVTALCHGSCSEEVLRQPVPCMTTLEGFPGKTLPPCLFQPEQVKHNSKKKKKIILFLMRFSITWAQGPILIKHMRQHT